jgi:hypothetical protein
MSLTKDDISRMQEFIFERKEFLSERDYLSFMEILKTSYDELTNLEVVKSTIEEREQLVNMFYSLDKISKESCYKHWSVSRKFYEEGPLWGWHVHRDVNEMGWRISTDIELFLMARGLSQPRPVVSPHRVSNGLMDDITREPWKSIVRMLHALD